MQAHLAEMFQSMGMGAGLGLGTGIIPTVGSPHTPLLGFETTGGIVDDPEYVKACRPIGSHHLSSETSWLRESEIDGDWKYEARSIAYATKKALEAYDCKPAEAARRAREALAMDARCPEAFHVLATHAATSLEEALAFYVEGIRQGPYVMTPDRYARASTFGQAFMVPPMRGMFRCVNGAAIVLLKLGRYEESYNMYHTLRKLDDNGYRYSSYTNFRYHLPILLMRYKGLAFAEKYMHRPAVLENYTLVSTQVSWVYTQALMDFKRVSRPYFPWHYFGIIRSIGEEPAFGDTSAQEKIIRSEAAIIMGMTQAPFVLEYLLGDRKLPKGPLPITFTTCGAQTQAVAYVHAVGDLWATTPGALEWARQIRNVWRLVMLLRMVKGYGDYSFKKAKALFNLGGWKLPGIQPRDEVERDLILFDALSCDLLVGKGAKGDIIDLLVREGGCNVNVIDSMKLRPINKALYYDRDPTIVQALIRNGANVGRPSREDFSPLAMALNQGNHLALRAALEVLPNIASDKADLRSLYIELFNTNVPMCIRGLVPGKCMRCQSVPDMPHSKNISFEKCVDVLAEHGLRLDASLEKEAIEEMSDSLQMEFVKRLRMQGKLADRRNKLAKAAKARTAGGVADTKVSDTGGTDTKVLDTGVSDTGVSDTGVTDTGGTDTRVLDTGVSDGASGAEACGVNGGANGTQEPAAKKGKKKKKKGGPVKCKVCGKSDVRILRCSKCNIAGYCSAECQKVDWPQHKVECKVLVAGQKDGGLMLQSE